ncbi:MAG: site-2 protease family protein [Gemmataceae bacterium]
MSWSVRVGRIAGIDVYIHLTFLILLGWVGFQSYSRTGSVDDALAGVGLVLAVFGVVVLHELGHALAARRYGIQTRDITLLPIGGVARLERMPENPLQELVVAVAGPLVNVVIAAGLYAGLSLRGGLTTPWQQLLAGQGPFAEQMFVINVWLVVFNLIPAFPMDGGRVLRAFLALTLDYARATQIAALVGQGLAMAFGLLGLFGHNPLLVFVALFVWMGAAGEASVAQMRAALAGIPVRRAMVREFATVDRSATLRDVANKVLDGYQPDFPVVEGGKVVGVICQPDLLSGLTAAGPDALVERSCGPTC